MRLADWMLLAELNALFSYSGKSLFFNGHQIRHGLFCRLICTSLGRLSVVRSAHLSIRKETMSRWGCTCSLGVTAIFSAS
jgi:hypothetical protein